MELVEAQRDPPDDAHGTHRCAETASRCAGLAVGDGAELVGREIRAGGERVAGAGEDQDPVPGSDFDLVEHGDELTPHQGADRVLLLRSVERDRDDALVALEDQRLHRGTVSPWAPTRFGSGCSTAATRSSSRRR